MLFFPGRSLWQIFQSNPAAFPLFGPNSTTECNVIPDCVKMNIKWFMLPWLCLPRSHKETYCFTFISFHDSGNTIMAVLDQILAFKQCNRIQIDTRVCIASIHNVFCKPKKFTECCEIGQTCKTSI